MRYLFRLSYDGSKFYGFQRQKDKDTVQNRLEDCLTNIVKAPVLIKGAGRTDKGVHALDQTFHADLPSNINKLYSRMNRILKPYIFIKSISMVPDDFHARHLVYEKTYQYKINLGDYDPLSKDYIYQYNYELDIAKMHRASKLFLGPHNFQNLVSGSRVNYDSIIKNITFKRTKDILIITFIGKSFYKYMVRNMVGSLILIGQKAKDLNYIRELLDPQKNIEPDTAPPEGLYLTHIKYKNTKF